MYSQSQAPCENCNGTGVILEGAKIVKEKKILTAVIDKGSPNGYQYTFHGEADEYPGQEPGDVIIIVKEQPHKKFKRKGADLLIEQQITLLQALTGVDFVITHLDGTKLRIKSKPGEVIKPDDIKTVPDKGLPFHKQSYKYGNLYVIFKVTFPQNLNDSSIGQIKSALSMQKKDDEDMDAAETVTLVKYDESQRNTHAQGGT